MIFVITRDQVKDPPKEDLDEVVFVVSADEEQVARLLAKNSAETFHRNGEWVARAECKAIANTVNDLAYIEAQVVGINYHKGV